MTKATITQAKARLDALIDAALRGERVVITHGSKPAVAIVPVDPNGLPALRVSDAAADYLGHEARVELEAGVAQVHESHKALLDARQAAVVEGREKILNWDAVKHSLRVTRR